MKIIIEKIYQLGKIRKIILKIVIFFLMTGLLAGLRPVLASEATASNVVSGTLGAAVASLIGWITSILSSIIGLILTLLIKILVNVAQFNNIINVDAVSIGWVIVRDLCNMFFILILLVIAFATILRVESYQWKKMLPKLLIMAVLINFSKTICGLIIDFSQVIMLTFVSGFSQYGAANFINLFNLQNYQSIKVIGTSIGEITNFSVAGAFIAGLIAMIITTIVVLVMIAVLIIRVVMLWIYVILSPVAFLAAAFPAGQKYSSQWWSEFTKYVITGPVLAFFIWLALTTAIKSSESLGTFGGDFCAGINAFFCEKNLQTYIITIGLLVGGLMVTQQVGGIAGSIAGKGMQWARGAGKAGLLPLKGAKALASFGLDKVSHGLGIDLNVVRGYRRLKAQREENIRVREAKVYGKAVRTAKEGGFIRSKLALGSTGDVGWQNIVNWNKGRNLKRLFMGGKWAEKFHKRADVLGTERKNILSKDENSEFIKKMSDKRVESKNLDKEIETQKQDVATAPANKKDEAVEKLKRMMNNRGALEKSIDVSMKEYKTKKVDDPQAKKLDKEIEENKKKDREYTLMGAEGALALNKAELETLQQKKVAHLDNADQLGRILAEAVATGNEGLIAAVSKKMTRNSDYNEMMKHMNLGTGRDGLLALAKKFQKEGGMTEQAALGLIGEIGVIGKNIKHFGAFGAVKMEGGRWKEADDNEYNQAMLAEMLKLEPQIFAREVNRLGLGHYEGPKQTVDNWRMSKAAVAYINLNAPALETQYVSRGMQNALEHIYARIDDLRRNNVPEGVLKVIENRARGKGRGADVAETIKSVKT